MYTLVWKNCRCFLYSASYQNIPGWKTPGITTNCTESHLFLNYCPQGCRASYPLKCPDLNTGCSYVLVLHVKTGKKYSGSGSSHCLNIIKMVQINFSKIIAKGQMQKEEVKRKTKAKVWKLVSGSPCQITLPLVMSVLVENTPSWGKSLLEIDNSSRCVCPSKYFIL